MIQKSRTMIRFHYWISSCDNVNNTVWASCSRSYEWNTWMKVAIMNARQRRQKIYNDKNLADEKRLCPRHMVYLDPPSAPTNVSLQMPANAWQIWWIWYIPTRLFHLVDSDLFGCANNETYLMSTEYTYNEEHEQCWATVYREKKAISTCMAVGFCKLYSNPAISSALVREYIIFFLSILSSLHSLSLLLCVPTEYHPGELAARCGVSANRADILMTVLKFKIKFNIRQLTNQVKCVSSEQ